MTGCRVAVDMGARVESAAGAKPAGPIGFWLGWLGVVVGAMSAISAVTRLMSAGLAGIFADMVAFYRGLVDPIAELVNLLPLPFHIPPVATELALLYLVLLAMSWRASIAPFFIAVRQYNHQAQELDPAERARLRRTVFYRLPWRILSWLLLWPVISLQPLRRYAEFAWEYRLHASMPRKPGDDPVSTGIAYRKWGRDFYRNVTVQLFALPLAVILFFLANAYA